MADTHAPGTGAPAAAAATEKPAPPSFSAVAEERRDARTSELRDLAGVPAAEKTDPPAGPSTADEFDFNAEWNKVPERVRQAAAEQLYTTYNAELAREYGDVLPLIVEARKNPELRSALAEMATKEELRQMIADPEVRKHAKDLTKKELREFLFGEATTTYEKYATPEGSRASEVDPRDARIAQLETSFQTDLDNRETQSYIGARRGEVQALMNANPALAQDGKYLQHVVELAETRFESAALRAGVDTKLDGWPARAIRAGVKPPSYLEMHQYQAEVSGRAAPPAAPATSAATPPAPPQAPRTPAEGKKRGLELVKKAGGFNALAAAANRRGR